jgi:thioredoxin reductase
MKVEESDYVVVGFSLAGLAAAMKLSESGGRVVLLDFHRDTDTISDLPRIQATSLGSSASGVAFEQAMREALQRGGVDRRTTCLVEALYSDGNVIVECADRRWSCRGAVFAPNGTEPGIDVEGSKALHGFGISYSAAADVPFYGSRRVAVYGDRPRVIEHAWTAAQYVSEVIVLVKDMSAGGDPDLLSELQLAAAVTFDQPVVLRSVRTAKDGTLTAVETQGPTGNRWIDVSALFVAQHLVPSIEVVRHGATTDEIVFAGLSAGIDYWNHPALVADGVRAANALLAGVNEAEP